MSIILTVPLKVSLDSESKTKIINRKALKTFEPANSCVMLQVSSCEVKHFQVCSAYFPFPIFRIFFIIRTLFQCVSSLIFLYANSLKLEIPCSGILRYLNLSNVTTFTNFQFGEKVQAFLWKF